MNKSLHRHFVKTAIEFSPRLSADIKAAGPMIIPNRKHQGIGEFLSRVIIGQQLSTKAAATIWQRVREAGREQHSRVIDFFVEQNIEQLRSCGVSGNKAKALLAIRAGIENGSLSTRKLNKLSTDQRGKALMEIHGIGRWTADIASIFFFCDEDVWPDGDLSVVKVFNQYLNKRQLKSATHHAARFQPYRSYLAYYMWHLADNAPTK